MKGITQLYSNMSPSVIKLICARILNSNDSIRGIAKTARVSASTVNRFKRRLDELNIKDYQEIAELPPGLLYEKLYQLCDNKQIRNQNFNKAMPDFDALVSQMIEKKQTSIKECYQEYHAETIAQGKEPISLQYFSARVKRARDKAQESDPDYYYAQQYPYGLYAQLDFTGDQYELNTYNGKVRCWIMVVAFPASYYMQAQFVTSQSTSESCRVLGNVFRRIGNRHPSIITVDNAKCWVNRNNIHQGAVINRNFELYLQEIGICAEAAPPYKPQRKSCAEHSVWRVQELMKGIKINFSSNQRTIAEHNRVLMDKIDDAINKGPFRKSKEITRYYLFNKYELASLTEAKKIPDYMGDPDSMVVPRSYLVKVNGHEYSVPYLYIGKRVEIYTTNDYIIIKYEGKEIARHIREDSEGRSIKECHKPQEHQNIDKNNNLYKTTNDILRISTALNEGVYRFCLSKIKHDQNESVSENNTIRTCRAVINAYKRSPVKEVFAEACISVLTLPANRWNSYEVNKMYEEVLKEFSQKCSFSKQTEIFRTSTEDGEAYLRTIDEEKE